MKLVASRRTAGVATPEAGAAGAEKRAPVDVESWSEDDIVTAWIEAHTIAREKRFQIN